MPRNPNHKKVVSSTLSKWNFPHASHHLVATFFKVVFYVLNLTIVYIELFLKIKNLNTWKPMDIVYKICCLEELLQHIYAFSNKNIQAMNHYGCILSYGSIPCHEKYYGRCFNLHSFLITTLYTWYKCGPHWIPININPQQRILYLLLLATLCF